MGGKGGLNILPQKKWNVYNWDNRIKVIENEKIVNDQIEIMDRKKKDKNLSDKIKILKNVKHDEIDYEKYNFNYEIQYDKNKIFKEVMERKSMRKRLDVDLFFEKMNDPEKIEDEKIFLENKQEKSDITEVKPENITFKDSIKNNLNPWYTKKRKQDYELYKYPDGNDKYLNKKRNNEKDYKDDKNKLYNSHPSSKNSNLKKKTVEELRQERIEREIQEKEKINKFLNQKKFN